MSDLETAQERFQRDWLSQPGDRKSRGWDQRSQERKDREYYPHTSSESDVYTEAYKEAY